MNDVERHTVKCGALNKLNTIKDRIQGRVLLIYQFIGANKIRYLVALLVQDKNFEVDAL